MEMSEAIEKLSFMSNFFQMLNKQIEGKDYSKEKSDHNDYIKRNNLGHEFLI